MNRLEFAKDLARKCGKVILDRSKQQISAELKQGIEIVTKTDLEVENLAAELIASSEFDYPVLAEEIHKAAVESQDLWVIDPLDATTNFSKRIPRVSFSVAYCRNDGIPIVGVVYNPFTGELFYAESGSGAYLNDERICVSDIKNLAEAVVCVDSDYGKPEDRERGIKLYSLLAPPATRGIRQYASAALDLCYVAAGKLDSYVCAISPQKFTAWDFAAGGLILEEAGGRFTDFQGNPWNLKTIDRLATNKHLHNALMEKLRHL